MTPSDNTNTTGVKLVIAFAAVYLIWGSTYLAIRFAIETIPPFIMCGFRILLGGAILFIWSRLQGAPLPSRKELGNAAIVGLLMMVGGTGAVTWAEQLVPSGLTALVIGTVPLWIVFFDWLRPHGHRPSTLMVLGLFVGTIGVGVLIAPGRFAGADHVNPLGALVLVVACASWAWGSIYSRHALLPARQTMSAAMQLFAGGLALLILSAITGEWRGFDPSLVTGKSIVSFLYLAVFGTLAFAAYIWLLRASTPAKAATYAYVNPIVAVILGSTLGDEPFALRTMISALIIIAAVALIITAKTLQTKPVSATSSPLSNVISDRIVARPDTVVPATREK
jgi:drug/metabolite transporter (DMT)-like permease